MYEGITVKAIMKYLANKRDYIFKMIKEGKDSVEVFQVYHTYVAIMDDINNNRLEE